MDRHKKLHIKRQRQGNNIAIRQGLQDIHDEQEYWVEYIERENEFWHNDDEWLTTYYSEMILFDELNADDWFKQYLKIA